MSGALVPRGQRYPARLSRELERSADAALVHGSRVEAIEFVTRVGMYAVTSLSDLEGRMIEQCPLSERRNKALVDAATGAIADEIIQTAGGFFR